MFCVSQNLILTQYGKCGIWNKTCFEFRETTKIGIFRHSQGLTKRHTYNINKVHAILRNFCTQYSDKNILGPWKSVGQGKFLTKKNKGIETKNKSTYVFLVLTLVGHRNMWLKIIFLSQYRNIVCKHAHWCDVGLRVSRII